MRLSTLGRRLVLTGTILLAGTAGTAVAQDESQPCNPDGQPFAYGDVLAGCTIEVPADLDTFTFEGSAGEDVTLIITKILGSPFSSQCLELRTPSNAILIASTCGTARYDVVLTESGTHQVFVREQSAGTITFNLSIERLFPLRGPTPVAAGDVLAGQEMNPIADLDTFSYNAAAGDILRIIVTKTAGSPFSAQCTEIRGPDNSSFMSMLCGNIDVALPPAPASGTYQIIVTSQGHNDTVTYNMSLTCVSGACPAPPPTCLANPSYASGTLTLNFTVDTPEPVEWHVALLAAGSVFTLWKVPLPVIDDPASFALPIPGFPSIGTIGLLSTFTGPSGLTCSDLKTVNTAPSAPDFRNR
jgi:hypothetical protein